MILLSASTSIFRKSSLIHNHEMKNTLSATAISLYCLFSSVVIHADKPIQGASRRESQEELISSQNKLKSHYFVHKSVIIPHDDKKYRGGEDSAATSEQWLVGEWEITTFMIIIVLVLSDGYGMGSR
jgi:hypothetical protein